jgi:hypothetical protein
VAGVVTSKPRGWVGGKELYLFESQIFLISLFSAEYKQYIPSKPHVTYCINLAQGYGEDKDAHGLNSSTFGDLQAVTECGGVSVSPTHFRIHGSFQNLFAAGKAQYLFSAIAWLGKRTRQAQRTLQSSEGKMIGGPRDNCMAHCAVSPRACKGIERGIVLMLET